MVETAAPKGYQTVSPYLMIENPEQEIAFLERVFGGQVRDSLVDKNDRVRHAEVGFGDSVVMLGRAEDPSQALAAMVHMYVADPDESYRLAIEFGAESIMPPTDQFYGDRSAGVRSSNGIQWWIACQKEALTSAEVQERLLARG